MISPPRHVVAAFGGDGARVRRLPGGQDRAWYDGQMVLKPVDHPVEHSWVSEVFAQWSEPRVRVPTPIPAVDGAWSYAGWGAHRWVAGSTASMRADAAAIRAASETFHGVVSELDPPSFVAVRDDPWSYGDRVAWEGATPLGDPPTVQQIDRLRAVYGDVRQPPQVIHGDIGGNVLLAPGLAPAVIDWPPYVRPVGLALAVAVVDAIGWEGVPLAFVDAWAEVPEWEQLLARALVYRIATTGAQPQSGRRALGSAAHARACAPLLDLLVSRLG